MIFHSIVGFSKINAFEIVDFQLNKKLFLSSSFARLTGPSLCIHFILIGNSAIYLFGELC